MTTDGPMTKLTPTKLDAIRKRAEKATPGPWTFLISKYAGSIKMPDRSHKSVDFMHGDCDANIPRYGTRAAALVDAEFSAYARTDIPALLSHIAALEAELQAASDPAHKYWQPTPGAECLHCKRVVGTFCGCSVGGCPCGEDV